MSVCQRTSIENKPIVIFRSNWQSNIRCIAGFQSWIHGPALSIKCYGQYFAIRSFVARITRTYATWIHYASIQASGEYVVETVAFCFHCWLDSNKWSSICINNSRFFIIDLQFVRARVSNSTGIFVQAFINAYHYKLNVEFVFKLKILNIIYKVQPTNLISRCTPWNKLFLLVFWRLSIFEINSEWRRKKSRYISYLFLISCNLIIKFLGSIIRWSMCGKSNIN